MQSRSRKGKIGPRRLSAWTWLLLLGGLPFLWLANFAAAQQQTPSSLPGQSGPATSSPTTEQTASETPAVELQPGTQQSPPPASTSYGTGTTAGNLQFVEVRASSNLARITGPARERSFLTDGNNHAIDFSYLEDFTRGMHRLEVNSVLRYTDDIRTDPERNSVQRAYFRINGPRSEYNFGDYLVNYSSLTYNQNLKGFHFIQSAPWGQGFRLLGNAGTFTDRYGSLFREELPGKPFTRVVSGLRAEQTIDRDKMIALNWSYGNDIAGSLPGTTTFRPVVANNVASLDARMTFFNAWNLEGEIAYSSLSRDTRKRIGNRKNKDYALRFDNSVRKGPWNFNVYFTRIMPSFFAVNARQVADLQDLQARASVQLGERVSLQGSYRRTNNDLRGQNRRPETVFQMPDVRLSLRVVGNTLIDMGYKERHQDQFGSADRVTQTPFFQIGIPISSSVLSFGFEHRIHLDRLVRSNQTSSNDFSVGFRSIFNAGDWMFTPLLRYELNREIFDRVDTGNNNRNIQAGLILDAPGISFLKLCSARWVRLYSRTAGCLIPMGFRYSR